MIAAGARYAGIVSRTGAVVIDVVAFAGLSAGGLYLVQAATAMINTQPFGAVTLEPAVAATVVGCLLFVYFVGSWAVAGRTLGEGLLGLRVVRGDGRHVGLVRSVIRFWVSFLSFAALGLGFVWMLFDKRRRTWQDIVAGTVVIYDFDEDGVHRIHPDAAPAQPS
jgi:uncharacterized RDD family membrane protein YckC